MIRRIAHEIAERIRERPWADRVAGLVIPATRIEAKGAKSIFPVSCDISGQDCSEEQLSYLLPDHRRRSVIFIEDRSGARRVGTDGPWVQFQGVLRIVGWINQQQMGIDDPGCEGCGTASRISREIFDLLPARNTNIEDCGIVGLNIEHDGYERAGANPWQAYTLPIDRLPLLLPPYDHFGLDIVCRWRVHGSCLGTVEVGTPSNCAAPSPVKRRFPKDFTCEELLDLDTGLTSEQYECIECTGGSGGSSGECPDTTVNGEVSSTSVIVVQQGGSPVGSLDPDTGIVTIDECDACEDGSVQLKDSAGNDIGAPVSVPSGGSVDITAPDGTVNTTDGLTPVGLVKSSGSANLPPSRISYKDAANADQVTGDINTGFVASRIQPAYQFPRRQLTVNGVGTGQYVTLPDLADGTIPNVVSPLKFGWSAGDADTLTWTVTSDEAGTYTTYTQDGASGTITYSKNGGGFAALSGSITLAVSDTIVVRRTITTNAGWSRWAP